jgi:5,10-methylene-tetrahydrofolate dehydrogenase/methenyl tetrahydrofolate cyclohydrolase
MPAIDGKKIAREIIERLKSQPVPKKILAAILVGEDQISINFLKQKEKVAKELGIDFRLYKFPNPPSGGITNDQLRDEVGKIALLKRVGGVIIQLPLPPQLNHQYILNVIPQEKDIDVLGERTLGAFYAGRNPVLPPVVAAVEEILLSIKYQVSSIKVAIVGLGFLVGKPIATWLINRCPEIYLLDEGSDFKILKQADLVITGVGKSGLIEPAILKEGASVIDFGYSLKEEREEGKVKRIICGDLDTHSPLISRLSFYTPTPGGTGPIVVAKLFENFYKLCAI